MPTNFIPTNFIPTTNFRLIVVEQDIIRIGHKVGWHKVRFRFKTYFTPTNFIPTTNWDHLIIVEDDIIRSGHKVGGHKVRWSTDNCAPKHITPTV